jgi:hypothetical protein
VTGPRRPGLVGLAVGAAAGVLVLAPVLGRGYALSYDMVFVPRPPITGTVLGIDGSVPRAVPTDLVVALLSRVGPGPVVQQALLLLVFLLGGWGVARLVPGRAGGAAAAVAYLWNPYVAERLVIGHWAFLLGYALLPWLAGAALAVRRGTAGLPPLLLWLAAAALAGSTSALLGTGVALAVLGVRREPLRAAAVLGFAVLVNAPWWLPALARPGGVPADPAGSAAFAARADTHLGTLGSVLTLGGIWDQGVWPPERGYALLTLAALAGVAAALVLGTRPLLGTGPPDRAARPGTRGPLRSGAPDDHEPRAGMRGLLGAGAAGLVLTLIGGYGATRPLLTAVIVHVPGGGLLRDGQKLLAPAALVLALAAGHAVARLAATRRFGPYAVLLAAVPVLALPSLALGANGRLAGVHYPDSWLRLRATVAAQPPGDVAVLPWTLYRRFGWNGDRVLLDPMPRLLPRRVLVDDDLPLSSTTVRGEDPRAAAVTAALAAPGADVATVLAGAGARYAVVHRTQPGAAAAEAALAGLPVLFRSDDLVLVRLPGEPLPSPGYRRVLSLGLIAAGLGITGATAVMVSGIRRRRLISSAANDGTPRPTERA